MTTLDDIEKVEARRKELAYAYQVGFEDGKRTPASEDQVVPDPTGERRETNAVTAQAITRGDKYAASVMDHAPFDRL